MLAMHHWERMKLRHLLHAFVEYAVDGKEPSELELMEYYQCIRPSKKRKEEIKALKASLKGAK